MEAESFFARWEKRNAEAAAEKRAAEQHAADAPALPAAPVDDTPIPPPTMEDVAQLTPDSDFKRFVARGVDEDVRRSAMKKLFANPHFNVMDGLDVYIDDYNKFEPIPAAMLAKLNHAHALLHPLEHLKHPLMRLIDAIEDEDKPEPEPHSVPADTGSTPEMPEAANRGDMPPTEEQSDNDHPV